MQLLSGIGLWSLGVAGPMVPEEARGLYAAANSIARLPTVLAVGMTGVLVGQHRCSTRPRRSGGGRESAGGATRALLVLLVPATAILAVEAPGVMTLIFAERYAGGGDLLAVLVLGQGRCSAADRADQRFGRHLERCQCRRRHHGRIAGRNPGDSDPGAGSGCHGRGDGVDARACAVAFGAAAWLATRRIGVWLRSGDLLRLAAATAPVACWRP